MIVAMLVLAATIHKPFIVEWEIKWAEPLKPTRHVRAFVEAAEAVEYAGRAKMCKSPEGVEGPPPCVAWVATYVSFPAEIDPDLHNVKRR